MGRLGVVLGLCVACEGKMRSLGDQQEAGGAAGKGTQSMGGNVSGSAGIGGVSSGTGGRGLGVAGNDALVPYVQEPTLPIDPTCTCPSPAEICNAARQCVPRCDAAGRCAMWLSPHGVKDLYIDGSTVFVLVAPTSDDLGNPIGDGSLYRAEYPNGTPTLVATGIQDPSTILGRHNGVTVIGTAYPSNSTIRVTDAGNIASIVSDTRGVNPAMLQNWLAYADASGTKVWGIDLDGDPMPQLLVDLQTTNADDIQSRYVNDIQILDDYFWFELVGEAAYSTLACYLNRANLALGPTCSAPGWIEPYEIFATHGNHLFGAEGAPRSLESLDIDGKSLMKLFSGELLSITGATYSNGWLYSISRDTKQLVRFPSTVGRLPQEVLPTSIVQSAFYPGDATNSSGDFAVGAKEILWVQGVTDFNQPQYIFHAPLPPQPCDAELPCADSTLICSNGYCAAP
jgi:hypothetical protein